MKNPRLIIISIALALLALFFVINHQRNIAPPSKCGPYRIDKVITLGGAKFNAEVVATKTEQAKGLSGRPCIEANQAMLFDFGRPGQWPIWMKEMKFPIDVLWVSTDQKIVGMERDIKPDTYPDSFANKDKPAQYVIEMKANRTKELNLTLGQSVNL